MTTDKAAPKTFDRQAARMPRLEPAGDQPAAEPRSPAPVIRPPSPQDRALIERLIELIKGL
jgi:hypothetical protein